MKLIRQKNKIFDELPLSGLFVSEYLPGLSGDAVRLYLTLMYYEAQGLDADADMVARVLGVDRSVIDAGMIELESKGLIAREGNAVYLQNLPERHVQDRYNPRSVPKNYPQKGDPASESRVHLLRAISERFFGGQMSQAWYSDILFWIEKYGFCDEVVFMIFQQNVDKPFSRSYLGKVMEEYGKRGIKTVEQMNDWLARREEYVKVRSKVARNLKLNPMTVYQERYVEKWFYDYGYGFDIIDLALTEAAGMKAPSFTLYDKILTSWHDAELTDAVQVKEYIKKRRAEYSGGNKKSGDGSGSGQSTGTGRGTGSGRKENYSQRKYGENVYDDVYKEET